MGISRQGRRPGAASVIQSLLMEGTAVCEVFEYLMVRLFQTSSQRSISWPRSISAMHGPYLQRRNWGFSSKSRRPMGSARSLGMTRSSWQCRPTRWYEGKCLVLTMQTPKLKPILEGPDLSSYAMPTPAPQLFSAIPLPLCPLFVLLLPSWPLSCGDPGHCCLCRSISTSVGWTQTSLALKQT